METTPSPLRLGIVGLNNQGRDHAEAARDSDAVALVALCDPVRPACERAIADFGLSDVVVWEDYDALFASGTIEAAVVAVPHDVHLAIVESAARHGVHLLKEKPLGRTVEEAHRFAAIMHAADLVLHTAVQRRHHPTYGTLSERLKAHKVLTASVELTIVPKEQIPGQPRVRTWRDDFVRAGGGVLIDLGYHGVDLLHYLLGPMHIVSSTLWHEGAPTAAESVESDASVWAMAGPVWVHMRYGRGSAKREVVTLDCEQGRVVASRTEVMWYPHEGPAETWDASPRSWHDTMVAQFDTFVRAIRDGDTATNDLDSQIYTLRFLQSCYVQRRVEGLLPVGLSPSGERS